MEDSATRMRTRRSAVGVDAPWLTALATTMRRAIGSSESRPSSLGLAKVRNLRDTSFRTVWIATAMGQGSRQGDGV